MKNIEDILDEPEGKGPAEWAAECRSDETLRAEVRDFMRQSGLAKVLKAVLTESGVDVSGQTKKGVAETIFAYGALSLTVLALSFIDKVRQDSVADGHPAEPCLDDPSCPFRTDIHPIHIANAIGKEYLKDASQPVVFMSNQPAAEA